jgi:recombination protein RecA
LKARCTPEELYQAYSVDRLPVVDIAAKFGYASYQHVLQARRYFNIPNRESEPELRWKLTLTEVQQQIALGAALGDGYLKFRGTHAVLALQHCNAQLEYLRWKLESLKPFAPARLYRHGQRDATAGQTFSHPFFSELQRSLYHSGRKRLTDEILSKVGPQALAVWYMDDGSLKDGRATLATNCFTRDEHELITDHLAQFGIIASIWKDGRGSHVIGFGKGATGDLLRLIRPFGHESMSYKFG